MEPILSRAETLKQAVTEFVLEAEGELATALEQYSALHLSNARQKDLNRSDWTIDRFLIEGLVNNQSPLQLFLQQQEDFFDDDRHLIESWHRSFVGLFAVTQVETDQVEVMNWLTAKHYWVALSQLQDPQEIARIKPGEILLAQIAPLTEKQWMFFSSWSCLGKLGKPKLAVAIGNFKQNYKDYLYSDAPELLAEAWLSVKRYHQNFIDFFGSNVVTLPGWQLSKRLNEFQTFMTQKQFEAAGLDDSKSLKEMVEAANLSEAELMAAADQMGMDRQMAAKVLEVKKAPEMVAPAIELPAHLKKAEAVTLFTDP
jgi:hypothetical protein